MGFDLWSTSTKKQKQMEEGVKVALEKWKQANPEQANNQGEVDRARYILTVLVQQSIPGFYFCNNMWWWSVLWTVVGEVAIDEGILTVRKVRSGFYNDGTRISTRKATLLATALRTRIDKGWFAEWSAARAKWIRENPLVDCYHCGGLGVVENEECLLCQGTGKRDNPDKGYEDFDMDNLEDFIEFCENSGGFAIC